MSNQTKTKVVWESDPKFQTLKQLYLHGANREKNEPGFHNSRNIHADADQMMLADILFAYSQLFSEAVGDE